MKFKVPQFIETEEKIIGPFTLKQFLWVGGGVALLFIIFQLGLNVFLSFLIATPIVAGAGMMAFLKIDGISLPVYLLRMLTFLTGTKRYYFKKEERPYYENIGKEKLNN